jgi:hypothetical protein
MRSFIKASVLFPSLLLSLAGLAACTDTPSLVAVPDTLRGASSETVAMVVPAKGVQIYECRAKQGGQPGAYEWAFVGPEADLFDAAGTTKIGRHYSGPTWESADGSKITGALKSRADAPQPTAIPWLLLTATPAGPKGSFSTVTGVQRVNTVGGVAPAAPCAQGNAGTVARVPYTADYYFLSAK